MKKEMFAGLLAAIVLLVGAAGLFFLPEEPKFSAEIEDHTDCWVIPKGPWTTVWQCERDMQAATDACGKCCSDNFKGNEQHICSNSCGTIHVYLMEKCKRIKAS